VVVIQHPANTKVIHSTLHGTCAILQALIRNVQNSTVKKYAFGLVMRVCVLQYIVLSQHTHTDIDLRTPTPEDMEAKRLHAPSMEPSQGSGQDRNDAGLVLRTGIPHVAFITP